MRPADLSRSCFPSRMDGGDDESDDDPLAPLKGDDQGGEG